MSTTPQVNRFPLTEWDPANTKVPFSALFIASRRSGKSVAIKHLYTKYWAPLFDIVAVMCGSGTEFYEDFVPGDLFSYTLKPERIQNMVIIQKRRQDEGKEQLNILLIVDDCSEEWERNNRELLKIYTQGRHSHISVVYSTQATQLTSTVWRTNSDYIFIGRQMGAQARIKVAEEFLYGLAEDEDFAGYKNEKEFDQSLIKDYTRDHWFVVLDNWTGTDFKTIVHKWRANLA